MSNSENTKVCKSCGASGSGTYCSQCGQAFALKRITLHSLLHDVFHFFTHLDKGFGFTLKSLVLAPGTMQRTYVDGDRSRHQKPFSMFFICATVAALIRYWVNLALVNYYDAGDANEGDFFNQYMVMFHIALLPLYSYITFLFFRNSRYNYGEVMVLTLYTLSFFFLAISVISLLRFIWKDMDTAFVELPLLAVYNVLTLIHFFNDEPRWKVILKTLVIMVLFFLIIDYLEKYLIGLIYEKG